MIIKLRDLEELGYSEFAGTQSASAFGVEEAGAEIAGELSYSLEAGVSDGGFWARGTLRLPVILCCVNCLEKFTTEISVPDFAMQTELDGMDWIDLTEWLREDILLNLPPYPKCDSDGGKICPVRFTPVEHAPVIEEKPAEGSVWSALDEITRKN